MTMIVGTCRIVLAIPGADSLKAKRKVLRSLIDRMRSQFNVAVAEVDAQDVHRKAVIGLAVVSNDARHATSMLDTLRAFVAEEARDAVVADSAIEIVHVGGLAGDAIGSEAAWKLGIEPTPFSRPSRRKPRG